MPCDGRGHCIKSLEVRVRGRRAVVDWKMQPATKGEKGSPTDMGYPVYPPSLYRQDPLHAIALHTGFPREHGH